MSKRHGSREQKRLAKQKAKRVARRRQLARQGSADPTVRLQSAGRWPVSATFVPENLWTTGVGNLMIARRLPNRELACGFFLVDVFCLGIKDAHWAIVAASEFDDTRRRLDERGRLQDVPPEYFAKLIYRAADYAKSLGFLPHRDFRHASRLLAGIDPTLCPDEFEFGQDGRPLYVRGPYESLDRAHSIAKQVVDHGGDYIVGLSEPAAASSLDFFEEDFDEYDDDDGEDVDFEEDDLPGVRFRDIDETNMLDDSSTPPDAPPDPPQPNRR